MYRNILKKDLKRKKTMNFILLIFITMASMFVSSSANNMISILNATDTYFQRAGLTDYFIATAYEEENEEKIQNFLNTSPYVSSWDSDEILSVPTENWETKNGEALTFQSTPLVMQLDLQGQKFFDSEN